MSGDPEVRGKTVVLIGASSGFGRGAALRLAGLGASVVLVARRFEALLDLQREIEGQGGQALAVGADVSDPVAVEAAAAAAVERFGRIDVWVNNAGIVAIGQFWDIPIQDHARIVEVNLTGLIHGAHAALRRFTAQGDGVLVNVGSVESEVPLAFQSSYAATKAGVLSLSRSLNEELRLAGYGDTIRVGTIMPWAVDTPLWSHAANYSGRTPRMAALDDPEIVVEAIVAACTDPQEEQRVGWKAQASTRSHALFPDTTERLSANLVDRESKKGSAVPPTTGAIYEPMAGTARVDGGARDRMRAEDAGEPIPVSEEAHP
ncbi:MULTISPECIES: SDR family NAD(P)-dependent oxidoreductase [unclassified Leifsonia]|uniref:SDR family NAD(P)-dependent oxidoreductase n=1 Tax=unclassified Leifsonia TaxID=2663824 RepID=UPI000701A953|nr:MULTISPECIES: SDR family NAD(P)-dependent oxidoreductase [unclassified Leifsonia]KQX06904.1 oxidoreductase [Leifsonia sp. Root1293]KRA11189.1 oxidoreductase [Leifsonia sp. Root60]